MHANGRPPPHTLAAVHAHTYTRPRNTFARLLEQAGPGGSTDTRWRVYAQNGLRIPGRDRAGRRRGRRSFGYVPGVDGDILGFSIERTRTSWNLTGSKVEEWSDPREMTFPRCASGHCTAFLLPGGFIIPFHRAPRILRCSLRLPRVSPVRREAPSVNFNIPCF